LKGGGGGEKQGSLQSAETKGWEMERSGAEIKEKNLPRIETVEMRIHQKNSGRLCVEFMYRQGEFPRFNLQCCAAPRECYSKGSPFRSQRVRIDHLEGESPYFLDGER